MAEMLRENGLSFSFSSINGSNIYKYPQTTRTYRMFFSPGQPTVTEADRLRDLAPDEIASVLIPTSISKDMQGQLNVAVTVFEEPTFFPLPPPTEINTGLETQIGTPVVSVLVARDQKQLQFINLDSPLVLNLAIAEEEVLSFLHDDFKAHPIHTYLASNDYLISFQNVVDARCVFWDFENEGVCIY